MLSQEHINDETNRLLKPGNIFYLFCDFIIPKPKWKYMLLVGLYGKAHFFVINSSYTEYIRKNAYPVSSASPLNPPRGDLFLQYLPIFCPPPGGMGGCIRYKFFKAVLTG